MRTVLHSQDKSADFSSSSSVGQKNRAVSQLVTGSYEVSRLLRLSTTLSVCTFSKFT